MVGVQENHLAEHQAEQSAMDFTDVAKVQAQEYRQWRHKVDKFFAIVWTTLKQFWGSILLKSRSRN